MSKKEKTNYAEILSHWKDPVHCFFKARADY